MGVPKFFRWMSERYPMCSQLIEENKIPEFDNLYLDMNGIIHPCSHPSDDVHFRLTEEQIFLAIFNYIDHLFAKIKPKKLFFMAVDGVAPRAKMNQQRARRFRTAKDSAEAMKKALEKGEELPKEPPFDSNCITPGTEFMCKLSEQLKYFVNKKVTEDASWQGIEIILSGQDVPGEGEHKIMEYLRLAKSRPDYDSNVRHCLYGLDADLIMLGLLSHEPHFALLREEIVFGRSKKKTSSSGNPETQNFFLMHLCILREYLNLEFHSLKKTLPFQYDLERIIDDFVFMGFFVGNDFLPHLPNLHINEGALAMLFNRYKAVLPRLDGYLHDHGKLDLGRVEQVFAELVDFEREHFENELIDSNWVKTKRGGRKGGTKPKPMTMSSLQKTLYIKARDFVALGKSDASLELGPVDEAQHEFIQKLARDLGLSIDMNSFSLTWFEDEDEDDDESAEARERSIRRYEEAIVEHTDKDESQEERIAKQFEQWKAQYYKEKLEFKTPEDVRTLVFEYIKGLQWVLLYYYEGVPSWEWFYPFHYAPKISDLKQLNDMRKIKFSQGKPFKPFEQLMGVLPSASRKLLPTCFSDLMWEANSPIIDFYPSDFETDLNGKKNDWEAIVKIPFIDEKRLLAAVADREKMLTPEERSRNSFGNSFIFKHQPRLCVTYPSCSPGIFPDVHGCSCDMSVYNLPVLGLHGFKKGLMPDVGLGANALPGFPTLETLPFSHSHAYHAVNVFESESKNESIVVTVQNTHENADTQDLASFLINKVVHVGWPFLWEAKVISLQDRTGRYNMQTINGKQSIVKAPIDIGRFSANCERAEIFYSKRFAAIIGPVDVLVNVKPLKGMRINDDGSLSKDFDSPFMDVPLQTLVTEVAVPDPRFIEQPSPPVEVDFPIGSNAFFLGSFNYGCPSEVSGYSDGLLNIKLLKPVEPELQEEFAFPMSIIKSHLAKEQYFPSNVLCRQLRISPLALSKIAASLFVINSDGSKVNIGLGLKFEAKQLKVLGYSRKSAQGWEYSNLAVQAIEEYKKRFPEVFVLLEKTKQRSDMLNVTEFFEAQHAARRLDEIRQWIKSLGHMETVAIEADAVDKNVVLAIEEAIDKAYSVQALPPKYKPTLVKNVPRQAVLKPSHARHRLSKQVFALGDRIVHVFDSGVVPVAAKGTVVGLDGSYLDVLFDKTFMGGNELGGRCSPYRGLKVKRDVVLNITNPQVHSVSHHRAQQTVNGYNPQANLSLERKQNQALQFKPSNVHSSRPATADAYVRQSNNRPSANAWDKNKNRPASAQKSEIESIITTNSGVTVQVKKKEISNEAPTAEKTITTSSGVKVQVKKKTDTSSRSRNVSNDELTDSLRKMLHIGETGPANVAQQLMDTLGASAVNGKSKSPKGKKK